jgi:ATP-binding cassette subfamily B protein
MGNVKKERKSEREKKGRVKGARALENNLYIMKLVWRISPGRVLLDFTKNAFDNFSWVFYSIVFIRFLFSSIESGKSFESVALFVLISIAVFMALDFFNKWVQFRYKPISDTVIYEKLYETLFDKATEVDLNCYEDAGFYNTYTIAMKEADIRVVSVLDSISGILFTAVAAVCVFGSMFTIDPYIILFALFPIIGTFIFGGMRNKVQYARDLDFVPFRRRMDYVNRVLYLQNYAKEIRLSNIFEVLKEIYDKGFSNILKIVDKYRIKVGTLSFWQAVTSFICIFEGVLCYGAYRAIVSKTVSLSEFTVLASAMTSGAWLLIGLSDKLVTSYQNGLYIENLRKFLEYVSVISEKAKGRSPDKNITSIEFSNVSFSYKGTDKPVLDNVNIKIGKYEKIALVGHNGAGKTTLVKLLMRLYDPTGGEIRVNGIPIAEYDVLEYRALFGTAFQDYQVFSMPISENILMKDSENLLEEERVWDSLRKSGAYEKVKSLPKEIHTTLTKEFDDEGVNLSGGELQKIAVARAYCKDFEIIIMDEPSSALDPVAEYKLYESMMEACRNKTVVFISHRLSSAVLADRVYLLEDGKIIEEGTHMDAIALSGKYADMFRKQAEKYVEGYEDFEKLA